MANECWGMLLRYRFAEYAVLCASSHGGGHITHTVTSEDSSQVNPEDGGITILRSVGNYLPVDRTSHPRRRASLATSLWYPPLSHYFLHVPSQQKEDVCITISSWQWSEQAVTQLVETLRYKPGGRGFDSRWCYWNFSLASFFRPHYGPGINSAYDTNISWGIKAADA